MNAEEPKHIFIKNGRTHPIYNESEFKTANIEVSVVLDTDGNLRTINTKDGAISLDYEAGHILLCHVDADRAIVTELNPEAFDILERIFTPTEEEDYAAGRKAVRDLAAESGPPTPPEKP